MDAPLDLFRASREELMALIVAQREQLAVLRRENARLATEITTLGALVTQLTARLGELLAALAPEGDDRSAQPTPMPGLKPTGTGRPRRTRPRRANAAPTARGASGCGRRRGRCMPIPSVRTATRRCAGGRADGAGKSSSSSRRGWW